MKRSSQKSEGNMVSKHTHKKKLTKLVSENEENKN